ncbi:MAG: phosphonate ABC transporter substrate-binding protein [Syntrophomonadaceae bacterium]|nr:phosphonate ABC transporter substrate-binding protein [Syntrophomonadaceae bacterium]
MLVNLGKEIRLLVLTGLVLILIASFSVIGCAPKEQATPKAAAPQVLRLALIPAEDIVEMMNRFEPARQYLEKEIGIKIEMFKALDYTAVIEAMRAKKVEIAYFGPFSYVLAAERANAQAIVAGGDADGKLSVYHSILITHKDSGLQNIDDVKARAASLTVSFVDPASTSGYLIPKGYMESIGIKVDQAFKEVIFAGGHDASILAVHARKVDLGATWEGPYQKAIAGGVVKGEDVRVIWKSDPIPRSPVAVRGDLDPALIKRIQQAFLDMPKKAPEAFAQWEGMWEKNKSYVAVTGAEYEFIRQVAIGLGKLQAK